MQFGQPLVLPRRQHEDNKLSMKVEALVFQNAQMKTTLDGLTQTVSKCAGGIQDMQAKQEASSNIRRVIIPDILGKVQTDLTVHIKSESPHVHQGEQDSGFSSMKEFAQNAINQKLSFIKDKVKELLHQDSVFISDVVNLFQDNETLLHSDTNRWVSAVQDGNLPSLSTLKLLDDPATGLPLIIMIRLSQEDNSVVQVTLS